MYVGRALRLTATLGHYNFKHERDLVTAEALTSRLSFNQLAAGPSAPRSRGRAEARLQASLGVTVRVRGNLSSIRLQLVTAELARSHGARPCARR